VDPSTQHNLWLFPLDERPPYQLTNFSDRTIEDYASTYGLVRELLHIRSESIDAAADRFGNRRGSHNRSSVTGPANADYRLTGGHYDNV